jgi:hypothetical protein
LQKNHPATPKTSVPVHGKDEKNLVTPREQVGKWKQDKLWKVGLMEEDLLCFHGQAGQGQKGNAISRKPKSH